MSRAVRIVHAADFHLGSPFSGLSASKAGIRKAEQQDAFLRMIDVCKTSNAQILLLSGDIFDAVRVSSEHERFIIDALNEIPQTHIFIAPGNHDPYLYSSIYQSSSFGEHVHIFKNAMESFFCPELDTVVWGAAFSSSRRYKSLWPEGFSVRNASTGSEQTLHIVVMHGDIVSGPNDKSAYNPIRISDIEFCGADYVALGHVHDRSAIQYAGETAYAYPGCPEGRGYDERGPRGIFVGEIEKGRVKLSPVDINTRSFFALDMDVSGCGTQAALYSCVRDQLERIYGSDFSRHAYRITLTGDLPEDLAVEVSGLRSRLEKDVFDARIYDRTGTEVALDMLRKEKSLRGAFAEQMAGRLDQAKDDTEREQFMRALQIGLKAFESEVLYREDS